MVKCICPGIIKELKCEYNEGEGYKEAMLMGP